MAVLMTAGVLAPAWLLEPDPPSRLPFLILNAPPPGSRELSAVASLPAAAWTPLAEAGRGLAGLGETRHWLKAEIPPASVGSGDPALVVESKFPLFRRLTFYVVEGQRLIDEAEGGRDSRVGTAAPGSPYLHHHITRGAAPRTLYVETLADGPNIPHMAIREATEFAALTRTRLWLMGLLTGCSAFLLLYGLATAIAVPGYGAAHTTGAQAAFTAVVLLLLGYDQVLAPASSLDYRIWVTAVTAAYLWGLGLVIRSLSLLSKLDRSSWWTRRGYHLATGVMVGSAAMAWLIPPFLAPAAAGLGTLATTAWLCTTQLRYGRLRGMTWVLVAHWPPLVSAAVTVAEAVNLLPDTLYARFAAHLGVIWLGLAYAGASATELLGMSARQEQIRAAMANEHAKTTLNRLLTSVYEEVDRPIEAKVSIMFIDMVQFSAIASRRSDTETYRILAERMRKIIAIVEDHGGSVDRSLGDGILCFFGYGAGLRHKHHAIAALQAAIDVQRLAAGARHSGADAGEPLTLPMRVGIHSARVVIGNLGTNAHLDFTMIGSGVNLASRMETACAPFKIMVSESTMEQLRACRADVHASSPVLVAIKHKKRPVCAYEIDPFHDMPAVRVAAEQRFFRQTGSTRAGRRSTLRQGTRLVLESDLGRLDADGFSLHGFSASAGFQLGRGVTLTARLVSDDPVLAHVLQGYLLQTVVLEVRWSQASAGRYRHGLRIVGGSSQRREKLYAALRQAVGADEESVPTEASSLGMPA
jgi:class 3 adenylate cyclase